MAQVIWTEPALSDFNTIAEYIALDKPSAAINLVQNVFSNTDQLELFPELGRKPPEFNKSRYLEVIVNPCRIFIALKVIKSIYFTLCEVKENCVNIYSMQEKTVNNCFKSIC
ncbi:type II toxin-antitoxin system RelE/ParE family toxin [Methyloprofundus sp.]|uniref:type II toxin-antitoxin system RelE/ParE family toxin n=1 Tax=Methyloprofundus sp. TaxID=2020875 RepID=UPI003D0EE0B5